MGKCWVFSKSKSITFQLGETIFVLHFIPVGKCIGRIINFWRWLPNETEMSRKKNNMDIYISEKYNKTKDKNHKSFNKFNIINVFTVHNIYTWFRFCIRMLTVKSISIAMVSIWISNSDIFNHIWYEICILICTYSICGRLM